MTAISRAQGSPGFSAAWTGMSALGWATGSLLYLLTLSATAFITTALLGVPFGRAEIIIARELLSYMVFGITIGLSQAFVLAYWNSPRWPPLVGWSLGLPLGWAVGVVLKIPWGGLVSFSPVYLVRSLTGYVLITIMAVGFLILGWKRSGSSVSPRWFAVRVLGAGIAFGLVGTLSYAATNEMILSFPIPFDLAQLIAFPLLVAVITLIAEGLGSRILAKELFSADGTS